MSAGGFVHDLCVALVHRYDAERRFMVITGYFDESGTHAGSEVAVMAGFMGEARQWRKFEKRTSELFYRFRVDIFHCIDVRRSDKDFAGWSVDKKIEFLDEFHHVINETLEHGVAAILRYEDYRYYEKLFWPRGVRKDTLYTILCRACLAEVLDQAPKAARWVDGKEPSLNIVLESGHRHAADALRLYNSVQNRVGLSTGPLAGLTFSDKAGLLPLASADLFAYSVYGHETGHKPIGTAKKPSKSAGSYRGNASRVLINRETLSDLHQQAIAIANGQDFGLARFGEGQPS